MRNRNRSGAFFLLVGLLALKLPLSAAMLIDGYDPLANDRFANDPSFIAAAYDLSGLARSSSNKWGTLISPNVFLASEHWHPAVGNTLTFFETNDPLGASTVRTVIGGQRVGASDIWVGILDHSLPAEYTPFPFLDEPIADITDFENASIFNAEVFMVGRSATGTSVTNVAMGRNVIDRWNQSISDGDTTDSALEAISQLPGDPDFVAYESFLQLYDSSAPVLQEVGGELKIIALNWYIQEDYDINPHPKQTELVDLSGFSYVGNYAAEIQGIIDAFEVDATAAYITWSQTAFGTVTDLSETGPSIDYDGDGLDNFTEYAFVLDPESGIDPVPADLTVEEFEGQDFLELSFSVREDADLQYSVRLGSDLLGWTPVNLNFSGGSWASADPGLAAVVSESDLGGGIWSLTVRGSAALTTTTPQFLAISAEVIP
jgi:hypothetical protein